MAKEVTHAVEFRDPIQPSVGLDRQLFVLACDDGSLYEFQKYEDAPKWTLRRRGEVGGEPQDWTQRHTPLPADVEEVMDEVHGKDEWTQ